MDALSWAEYRCHTYNYRIPGLVDAAVEVPPGLKAPEETYFVTSPNAANVIPDLITEDEQAVTTRMDGRFHAADPTLFPQWYFTETYHLPFVRSKPKSADLIAHPLRLLWYNMNESDFIPEPGTLIGGYGRLNPQTSAQFTALRKELSTKIDDLVATTELRRNEYQEMVHCQRAMQFASIALEIAPQAYFLTVLAVTCFQRLYLEALACYEYHTVWMERRKTSMRHAIDTAIMGAFTCNVMQAEEFLQLGVPVWVFRHCATITKSTKIGLRVHPTIPEGCVKTVYPSLECIFIGHPSAIRNRACQRLRLQHVRLGHSVHNLSLGVAGYGKISVMPLSLSLIYF